MRPSWNEYFINIAYEIAKRSDDKHTQHGCILIDSVSKVILSAGYNNTLTGRQLSPEEYDRPNKYPHMMHSEINALLNSSVSIKNYPRPVWAYITGRPCVGLTDRPGCLECLIQVGIRHLFIASQHNPSASVFFHNEKSEVLFNELIDFYNVHVEYV